MGGPERDAVADDRSTLAYVNCPRTLLALGGAVLLLSGCAAAESDPTPAAEQTPAATSTAAPSQSATPEPEAPVSQPAGAIDLGCDALATEPELAELFGAPMPFILGDLPSDNDVLLQAGATVCRWGEGPFLDGPAHQFEITALPTPDEDFGAFIDTVAQAEYSEPWEPVSDLGDEAVVQCDVHSGHEQAFCDWAVRVGTVWLAVEAWGVPATELDVTVLSEYEATGVPRPDATISALLNDMVAVVEGSTVRQTAMPATGTECVDLLDTAAVASDLSVAPVTLQPATQGTIFSSFPGSMRSLWVSKASDELGITSCNGDIGVWSEGYHAGSLWMKVLPAGAWLEDSGLWPDAQQTTCRGWEGGPVCDLTLYGDETAVWIRTSGDDREAAMRAVQDHLQVPGLP